MFHWQDVSETLEQFLEQSTVISIEVRKGSVRSEMSYHSRLHLTFVHHLKYVLFREETIFFRLNTILWAAD